MGRVTAIGHLRERVQIVRNQRTQRPDGGYDTVRVTVAVVWASVQVASGADDDVVTGRVADRARYEVTMHARSSAHVVVDDELIWDTGDGLRMAVRRVDRSGPRATFAVVHADVLDGA